jgi:hypothetical protein
MSRLRLALAAAVLLAATPGPAAPQQRAAAAVTEIARLALPEGPQRSADADQETLALQLAETLGFACRGHEMWRWAFPEDDFPRAQGIVGAGERAFRERGYAVTLLPVEIDTVTAMQARLAAAPGAPLGSPPPAQTADANVLALWYVGERGVDLTLCRVRER